MHLTDKRNFILTLNHWCPNLKELRLTFCDVWNEDFFRQSLPSLEVLKLHDLHGLTLEYLGRYFSKLKDVSLERSISDDSTSWMRLANEFLINVEIMSFNARVLETLPPFHFDNLKSLTFYMHYGKSFYGTCTNDLLQVTKRLPKIEIFRVLDCLKNSITNDGLVELINRSGSTLTQLCITCCKKELDLRFGYDLHRNIYGIQSTSVCIKLVFGDKWADADLEIIKITKEGIWENRKLSVVASTLQNH